MLRTAAGEVDDVGAVQLRYDAGILCIFAADNVHTKSGCAYAR